MTSGATTRPAAAQVVAGTGMQRFAGLGVTAQLVEGEEVAGLLDAIDMASCRVCPSDAAAVDIPLDRLRRLEFAPGEALPTSTDDLTSAGLHVVSGRQPQRYRIQFRDGQVQEGESQLTLVDDLGIHLIVAEGGQPARRVLVPAAQVRSYKIGMRLGDALIAAHLVSGDALEDALARQEELHHRPIGEYLTRDTATTPVEVAHALDQQGKIPPRRLGELLIESGTISKQQLDAARARQREDRGKRIGEILVDMGAIDAPTLGRALGRNLGIPEVRLRGFAFDPGAAERVPVAIARKHGIVPLLFHGSHLVVASSDPLDPSLASLLEFVADMPVDVVFAPREDIAEALAARYLKDEFEGEEDVLDLDEPDDAVPAGDDEVSDVLVGRPVVHFVQRVLAEGIRRRASDIHLQPAASEVQVLYRVDGVFQPGETYGKGLHRTVVRRIKELGNMDPIQQHTPQDGKARVRTGESVVELRISTVPTVRGENVVIRVIDARSRRHDLRDLGLAPADLASYEDRLHQRQGLILVTGPTGSGKSTTLYASVEELRSADTNIITIEDPVEYILDGVQQIGVNPSRSTTFTRILRHILRQDPDVIMVGEIRDAETADLALKSALTGHLVLTTVHSNSAAATVRRLLDMDLPPYLVASTLLCVLAQRLLRRNCPACLRPVPVSAELRRQHHIADDEAFYEGAGCAECNGTGYRGRIPAYELLVCTDALRELIHGRPRTVEMEEQAIRDGMVSLSAHGLSLARSRVTSPHELAKL